MRYIYRSIGLCLFGVLSVAALVSAETLTGQPRVVDADTLVFDEERVRIEGVDAPESMQWCLDEEGDFYPCGFVATQALRDRIGTDAVTCEGEKRDRYRRLIGFCSFADGTSLNAWLVRQGHAIAYRKYTEVYVPQEEAAKAEQLGIWQGEFVLPEEWRAIRKKIRGK